MAAALSPGTPPPLVRTRRPLAPRLIGGGAIVALALGIWWAAHQHATMTRRTAEDSVLIPVVPPPPPPPPPEVKPEPRPEEVPPQPTQQQPSPQQPSPQPQAASPSAGQAVSIDGPAQAGGDAFDIGAGSGGGMRGGGAIGSGLGGFNRAAYAAYLEGEIRTAVSREPRLRTAVLRAKARLWIDAAGKVTRVEIGDSGAGQDRADAIRDALVGRSVRPPDPSLAMPVAISLELRRS